MTGRPDERSDWVTPVALAGLALDGSVVAAVNGARVVSDPWYPLARGDRVTLSPADPGD